MVNLTGSQLVLLLVFAVVQAFVGYFLAEADRRTLGRTPWGLPSLVWAAIWFFSLLIAVVLWVIAHRSEVRRSAQGPIGPMGGPAPIVPQAVAASDFPAYPRRADGGPRDADRAAPPGHAEPPPAAPSHVPGTGHPASPPAWHPDPSGRYHYRWWTGSEWTSYVSVHGRVEVDTSPDQRIGPYS